MRIIRETKHTKLTQTFNYSDTYHLVNQEIEPFKVFFIEMQTGPIKENGVNGFQNEDLIAICIDRLKRFQKGDCPCAENDIAIKCLEEALNALDARFLDRIQRGVEGTNKK